MPLPREVRKKYLAEIIRSGKVVSQTQIPYKETQLTCPVYEVRLDHLIFNQYNDRIAVEMKTFEAATDSTVHSEYNEKLEKQILDYLYKVNEARNEITLDDLNRKGQREPGVVTADGVIVNGNRRAMLLRKANKTFFKAAILPDEYEGNVEWIRKLETELQFGVDTQVEYKPLAKYLKVKALRFENHVSVVDIAKLMNEEKGTIEEWLDVMHWMDEYLKYIDAPGVYTALRMADGGGSKEDSFITLRNQFKALKKGSAEVPWDFKDRDLDKYKIMMFDYIRSECDDPKSFRAIGAGSKGRGIFASEHLFSKMYDVHKAAVTPANKELPTLGDYKRRPECSEIKDLEQLCTKRELEWQAKVKHDLRQNLRHYASRRESEVEETVPQQKIESAWTSLKAISDADLQRDEFVGNEECRGLVKEISRKVEVIKRHMKL
jgi:hypothetical protein